MIGEEDKSNLGVAEIYEVIMEALEEEDTGAALAAVTMALKDLALTHHGEPATARRCSAVALDRAFELTSGGSPSKAIH